MSSLARVASSFRDPSGYVFLRDGLLLRRIMPSYVPTFRKLLDSGLYGSLIHDGLLIPHSEVDLPDDDDLHAITIQPERVAFISYPYEWCFCELRDAALTTLRIQTRALEHGMVLKDASAFNIQFHDGRPVLIDTLSFADYHEGEPWVAYRQFCQHFLAPLALMSWCDTRLGQLLRIHMDGVPLDLAARMLPLRARLSPSLSMHVVSHARFQDKHSIDARKERATRATVSRLGLQALLDSLERLVAGLRPPRQTGAWTDYYDATNYTPNAFEHKKQLVDELLSETGPRSVWDLGANAGTFSQIASRRGIFTLSFDCDHGAVETCYLRARSEKDRHILPLLLDLTNPSPSLGWAHAERDSLLARGPADMVMALALLHHLAIGNNLPFDHIAAFLKRCAPKLLIEFVPKEDSQVRGMLSTREDVFPSYTQEGFEEAFSSVYSIRRREAIRESSRSLYLMEARG
jgi:hypothetical protein